MTNNCCGDNSSCDCGCSTNRANKLCELTKPHNQFEVGKILPLVDKPEYFCRCCGRLANMTDNLCNPILLTKK
jgi:hypothetical protein